MIGKEKRSRNPRQAGSRQVAINAEIFAVLPLLLAWLVIFPCTMEAQDKKENDAVLGSEQFSNVQSDAVEILSDKVYLYNYFNVLFKTPFRIDDLVRLSFAETHKQRNVQRTEKMGYSRYQDDEGEYRRAFVLGFYTVASGLLQLPSLRFQNGKGEEWLSPSINFASFRVDEGFLPLPVNIQLNPLPREVYLGQNIVLSLTVQNASAIDQSHLVQNPEFTGFLVQKSPVTLEVERQKILGQDVYRVPLGTWLLNPLEQGQLEIPVISASIMGLERQSFAKKIEVLPLPQNPLLQTSRLDRSVVRVEKHGLDTNGGSQGNVLKNNMLQKNAVAIGQFEVSFQLVAAETRTLPTSEDPLVPEVQQQKKYIGFRNDSNSEFAKDELIHVLLRLKGRGNIHMLSFPEVRVPSSLTLLQSVETESLDLDFRNADLTGWRQTELIYKAKKSGTYRIGLSSMHFFDPEQIAWRKTESQELTLHVVNLTTQSYYSNLEELQFSNASVIFLNWVFWLQEYAFYICLIIFLTTFVYFLLQVNNFPLSNKPYQKQSETHDELYQCMAHKDLPRKVSARGSLQLARPKLARPISRYLHHVIFLLQRQQHRFLFILLILGFVFLVYSLKVASYREIPASAKEYYLKTISSQVKKLAQSDPKIQASSLVAKLRNARYSPGDLPNIAMMLYRKGLPLQALELAYLAYFYQPLQLISQRLLATLRIQMGLEPSSPAFFLWPIRLYHIGKYLGVGLFLIVLLFCIRQKRTLMQAESEPKAAIDPQVYHYIAPQNYLAKKHLLRLYRNYAIVLLFLLFSLSLPHSFSLAINTISNVYLATIPQNNSTKNYAANEEPAVLDAVWESKILLDYEQNTEPVTNSVKPTGWSKQLIAGELLKIKGKANGGRYLITSEMQNQGWLTLEQLFLLPSSY